MATEITDQNFVLVHRREADPKGLPKPVKVETLSRQNIDKGNPNQDRAGVYRAKNGRIAGVVVSDGSYKFGEIAANIVVGETGALVQEYGDYPTLEQAKQTIITAMTEANTKVYAARFDEAEEKPMAATDITLIIAAEGGQRYAVYGSYGDSRLYLFRDGKLTQLSMDYNRIYLGLLARYSGEGKPGELSEAAKKARQVSDFFSHITQKEDIYYKDLRQKYGIEDISENQLSTWFDQRRTTVSIGHQESATIKEDLFGTMPIDTRDKLLLVSDGMSDALNIDEIELILGTDGLDEQLVSIIIDPHMMQRFGGKDGMKKVLAMPDLQDKLPYINGQRTMSYVSGGDAVDFWERFKDFSAQEIVEILSFPLTQFEAVFNIHMSFTGREMKLIREQAQRQAAKDRAERKRRAEEIKAHIDSRPLLVKLAGGIRSAFSSPDISVRVTPKSTEPVKTKLEWLYTATSMRYMLYKHAADTTDIVKDDDVTGALVVVE